MFHRPKLNVAYLVSRASLQYCACAVGLPLMCNGRRMCLYVPLALQDTRRKNILQYGRDRLYFQYFQVFSMVLQDTQDWNGVTRNYQILSFLGALEL